MERSCRLEVIQVAATDTLSTMNNEWTRGLISGASLTAIAQSVPNSAFPVQLFAAVRVVIFAAATPAQLGYG